MPQKENEAVVSHINLLVSLGTPRELLDSANLNENDLANIYQRLRLSVSEMFDIPLKINSLWQLYFLTGRLELVNQLSKTQLLSCIDNWEATAAHYAAWSGNRQLLEFVKKQVPHLFNTETKTRQTIFHFAAWSGNKQVLDWVKEQSPFSIQTPSIAHIAAQYGNIEALDWIKKHMPHLLEVQDNFGKTIAHWAALYGNRNVLEWISKYVPHLFKIITNADWAITHYTALSKDIELFNWTVSLSDRPHAFLIPSFLSIEETKVMSQTVLSALKDNLSLTEVGFPPQIEQATREAIELKLAENKSIKKAMPLLKKMIIGHYQEGHSFSALPAELVFEIFQEILPEGISKDKIESSFNKMMTALSPANTCRRHAFRLIDAKLEHLKLVKKPKLLGLVEGSKSKINALKYVRALLNKNYRSLGEIRQDFNTAYQTYYKVLGRQRNKIHSFFSPTHTTKSLRLLESIGKILDIQPDELTQLIAIPNLSFQDEDKDTLLLKN